MGYLIHRAGRTPALDAGFDSGEWSGCRTLNVDVFRPEGSGHRPETRFRLQYDREGLYGLFSVRDRFVRCVARKFQDPVCRDSCVEFFVRPRPRRGYVNFEFSAAGVLLAQHGRGLPPPPRDGRCAAAYGTGGGRNPDIPLPARAD